MITMEVPDIDNFLKRIDKYAKEKQDNAKYIIDKFTASIKRDAKEEAPKDFGVLASSIESEKLNGGMTGRIYANAEYATAVHEGTNPHVIEPIRAKALAFTMGGIMVFAKKVFHPGTKGNPFFTRALNMNKDAYIQEMREAMK